MAWEIRRWVEPQQARDRWGLALDLGQVGELRGRGPLCGRALYVCDPDRRRCLPPPWLALVRARRRRAPPSAPPRLAPRGVALVPDVGEGQPLPALPDRHVPGFLCRGGNRSRRRRRVAPSAAWLRSARRRRRDGGR